MSCNNSDTVGETFEGRFACVVDGVGAFGRVVLRKSALGDGISLPDDTSPTRPWILGGVEGIRLAASRAGRNGDFEVVEIETSNADTSDWSMRCAAFLAAWKAFDKDVGILKFDPARRMFAPSDES
ncbi:MAG TPA: hypothetical protein PKE00_13890 [Planctomycetota bacterium]|nr:hypothetical protein [Planctomycetota bacterium]